MGLFEIKKPFALALSILSLSIAAGQTPKPKLRVSNDGFPAGHDTPEGVAADLARAFIHSDVALFWATCVTPFGAGKNRDEYSKFLQNVANRMKQEARTKVPSLNNPKNIGKVFAARHLSRNGPASYGYASFGFQDVMFVDVGVFLQDGETALNRTLVVKGKDGKWYVHPAPDLSPLLSEGLNEEKASIRDFSDVYDVQK